MVAHKNDIETQRVGGGLNFEMMDLAESEIGLQM